VVDVEAIAALAALSTRVQPGVSAIVVAALLEIIGSVFQPGAAALGVTASVTTDGDLVASGVVPADITASLGLIANAIRGGLVSADVVADLVILATQVVPGALAVYMTVAVANTCLANIIASGAVSITATNSLAAVAIAYVAQLCGYTGNLIPGDVLEIDCDRMTVKLNGVDARVNFTGRFPKLYAGLNEVRYADTSAARTLTLDEDHDPRWL
jgi:hypothetical protein